MGIGWNSVSADGRPGWNRVDTNTLAVVNQREGFVGVITQEEIVRKVLTKVMREA